MTPWALEPALLVATCCATAAGSASRQPSGVPAPYKDVASYLAARARLVEEERARRPSSALPLSPEEEAADRRLAVASEGRGGAGGAVLSARPQLPPRPDPAAHRGIPAPGGHEAPAEGRDPARARVRGRRPPLARRPRDLPAGLLRVPGRGRPGRARHAADLPPAAGGRLAPGGRPAETQPQTRGRSTRSCTARSPWDRRTARRPTSGRSSGTASAGGGVSSTTRRSAPATGDGWSTA